MPGEKRTTYPVAFKEEAVRLYLEGGRSYRQLCEELGIKDKKTLRQWVAKVKNSESLEEGRDKSGNPRRGRPKTNFSSAEEELAYVKAERDYLKKLYRSRFGHEWGAHKKSQLFEIVGILRGKHPLPFLLHHSGLSKSGYYKWKSRSAMENGDR